MGRQDSERKYFDNTCIVWDTKRKEMLPRKLQCAEYVRDFKVTSIECKNSILVRYATLGTSLSRNMANI